jgi:RNA polymerase sigma-32 factor
MTHSLAISTGLETYLAEVERYPLLTPERERELAFQYYEKGDLTAAHALVTANLRFVIKVAAEYRNYGMKMLDLVQEGNLGLMMAVKKFNPHRGYRLITYAVWWIRAYIQKYILQSWSLVKIGTTQAQRKLFFKLNQTKNALAGAEAIDDKAAMTDAVASALDVKDKDVLEMEMRMSGRDFSLDNTLDVEGGDISYLDRLESHEPSQEEMLIDAEQTTVREEGVQRALATLNDRETYIVEHRILAEKPATLQEVGDQLKISRERVRQLEVGALKKLKGELLPAVIDA